jgi:hypothetical protein
MTLIKSSSRFRRYTLQHQLLVRANTDEATVDVNFNWIESCDAIRINPNLVEAFNWKLILFEVVGD